MVCLKQATPRRCIVRVGMNLEHCCRVAEDLAWAVGAPIDLPSRGAGAFLHTLQLAADKAGHTHLPWGVLLLHTQRLLSGTGPLASLLPSAASVLAMHGIGCYARAHSIQVLNLCQGHAEPPSLVTHQVHTTPRVSLP